MGSLGKNSVDCGNGSENCEQVRSLKTRRGCRLLEMLATLT